MYNLYNFLLPLFSEIFIILFVFRSMDFRSIIYSYLSKIHIFANLIINH